MKKSTVFTALTLLVLIPLTLLLGVKIPGRMHYLISTLIIIETMLPFFYAFESRKPSARELVMIAVMSALAAAARIAFVFLPGFKPITAIIMIAGIAFGAQAGFLTGAVSAFASNFFYGQGPWTPWQMMAYGFGGFLAGVMFHKNRELCTRGILSVFGFFAIFVVVGPLLDCCTVFTTLTKFTPQSVLFIFGQGVPVNLKHGISCAVTLALAARPLLYKLDRVRIKYGMMEEETKRE